MRKTHPESTEPAIVVPKSTYEAEEKRWLWICYDEQSDGTVPADLLKMQHNHKENKKNYAFSGVFSPKMEEIVKKEPQE